MHATTLLSDYTPFPFALDRVELAFRLAPEATRVRALLHLTPQVPGADLRLDGMGLRLISLSLAGRALAPADYTLSEAALTLPAALLPEGAFVLESEVEIAPAANTALEGLYMSNGLYCTQCEAEGFRHITFFPDRPDVMSVFSVRIESDLPVLLSNGNPVAQGPGWAEWHDPWPKPAYLFALVAGDLRATSGQFTTASGRQVALNVWVRPGDESRCNFALQALERSMKWDEEAYGREYDLDLFNIVAVDDFNMGAMENKGLNVFNSKLVLASPETATDTDYERIEAVIAHEYFHNWTGNRITCRDWFQLCLKEGLTVFRDQSFTAETRLGALKRIEDVAALRARQFREDAGPLAHPPRPDHYKEINNFYTATVYEKGAELVGMLKTLLGPEGYRAALDLYFARHDGEACTIEDWLQVFEDASGRDLTQFKLWYTQAGTPRLRVEEEFKNGVYTLDFVQETPPTPGQPSTPPRHIPIALGLLSPNGDEVLPTQVLEMTQARQSFTFEGLAAKPVPSILRGFSAPVVLERQTSPAEQAFLLAHDTDPFNRWEAGRTLARQTLMEMARGGAPAPDYLAAVGRLLTEEGLEPGLRAACLRLPGEDEIAAALAGAGELPDPEAIRTSRRNLMQMLAKMHAAALEPWLDPGLVAGPYSPDPGPAGLRALRLACLALVSPRDGGTRARALYAQAGNMTDSIGALNLLVAEGAAEAELAAFAARWRHDALVMDKWLLAQAALSPPESAVQTVARLAEAPGFDWKNPNRFRSLLGGLAANHAAFHRADGAGYALFADWLIRLDPLNPQTAARMSTAFETWARYDAPRRALARAALERIAAAPGLSRNLGEMVGRLLG